MERYRAKEIGVNMVLKLLKKEVFGSNQKDNNYEDILYGQYDTIFYEKIFERIKNRNWFKNNFYNYYFKIVNFFLKKAYQKNDETFRALLETINDKDTCDSEDFENFEIFGQFFLINEIFPFYKELNKKCQQDLKSSTLTLLKQAIMNLKIEFGENDDIFKLANEKIKAIKSSHLLVVSEEEILMDLYETLLIHPLYGRILENLNRLNSI